MSQADDFEEREDDADLESLLSPLKRIEPPMSARSEFRDAIASELERGTVHRHTPWWRRSIVVPVPVALTAVLLVVVSMALSLLTPRRSEPSTTQPQATLPASAESVSPDAIATQPPQSELPEVEYYSSETYLCGIGRISSVSGYSVREESHAP